MSFAKLIVTLLLPLGITLLLLAAALWATLKRRRATAVWAIGLSMSILWMGAMPVTARWAAGLVESHFPPLEVAQAPSAQAIVILGGGVAVPSLQGPVALGPSADRAWFAALLHRAEKAPFILVSGGGAPPEAPRIKSLLTEWGMPAEQILLEQESLSTRENALNSRTLLAPMGIERILLVTTAMHMPRAAASFTEAGFQVSAFPVGFRSLESGDESSGLLDLLPHVEALEATASALREILGWAYYRIRVWS